MTVGRIERNRPPAPATRSVCQSFLHRVTGSHDHGRQEAALHVTGIPYFWASRTFVVVSLAGEATLTMDDQEVEDNGDDAGSKVNWLELYAKRTELPLLSAAVRSRLHENWLPTTEGGHHPVCALGGLR